VLWGPSSKATIAPSGQHGEDNEDFPLPDGPKTATNDDALVLPHSSSTR
jgi:hypothetical protein